MIGREAQIADLPQNPPSNLTAEKSMIKRSIALLLVENLLACLVLSCASQSADETRRNTAPAKTIDVRLIAFNDFHGYITAPEEGLLSPDPQDASRAVTLAAGGAENFVAQVHRLQTGHPLNAVVAAGDLVGASPFDSALFHDEPTIELMNAIGLSLSSVGNHEFDHGREELLRLQNGGCRADGIRGGDTCIGGDFSGAKFHYLAANVFDAATGKPLFAPYEIKTFAVPGARSLRIGFIGLVLKGTASMVLPSSVTGLDFRGEAASANALVPQLQAQGVDAIVLLIHQGGSTSGSFNDHACPDFSGAILPIVDALDPAIRIIVSGHTHQAYLCRRGDRLITSAGSYGRLLTAIDLHFDRNSGVLRDFDANNFPVIQAQNAANESTGDSISSIDDASDSIQRLLNRYEKISAPLGQRVVGHLSAALSRTPNAAGESALGDIVADSMLDAASADGALIAFTNSGGLRQDLRPQREDGAITYAQVFASLPFGNTLVTMNLNGAQIKALLRQQRGFPQFRPLQISRGFSYAWSNRKLVDSSVKLNGETLVDDRSYRIVVNEFLAEGGDGFRVLKRGENRRESGHDLEAALAYFSAHSPLTAAPQNRISCLDCTLPDAPH
jgi:5'-nucleotidase